MPTPHTFPDEAQFAAYARAIDEDDGPVVMLNLNKFRDVAVYEDGRDAGGASGRETYLKYGMVALEALTSLGAKVLWMTDAIAPVVGCDHDAYDEILAVRAERQQLVTDFLATVTPEQLAEERDNPWSDSDDWHPTVGDCIRVILEEEWAHLRYIRRDLARLQSS